MCHLCISKFLTGKEHLDSCDLQVHFCTHDIGTMMGWFINNEKSLLRVGGSWHWVKIASGKVQIFRHTDEEIWDFFSSFLFRFLLLFCFQSLNWQISTLVWTGKPRFAFLNQVLALPPSLRFCTRATIVFFGTKATVRASGKPVNEPGFTLVYSPCPHPIPQVSQTSMQTTPNRKCQISSSRPFLRNTLCSLIWTLFKHGFLSPTPWFQIRFAWGRT